MGNTTTASVSEAARIDAPILRKTTKKARPKRPKTMEGHAGEVVHRRPYYARPFAPTDKLIYVNGGGDAQRNGEDRRQHQERHRPVNARRHAARQHAVAGRLRNEGQAQHRQRAHDDVDDDAAEDRDYQIREDAEDLLHHGVRDLPPRRQAGFYGRSGRAGQPPTP